MTGLARVVETCARILASLGYGEGVVGAIETDDPDALAAALGAAPRGTAAPRPANFVPMGARRGLLVNAMRELARAAPAAAAAPIALPAHAPFGGIDVRVDGCTLCLACVSACPTAALGDDPERPTLSFEESLCVQCGLCAATCPEKVIALAPRLDLASWEAGRRVVKREEPFACTRCARPFGTRGAVERVRAKLAAGHWMFSGDNARRLELVTLCESCRVEAVMNDGLDPYAAQPRPRPRTTEDYLRERAAGKDDLPEG
jgi:ferredoxin